MMSTTRVVLLACVVSGIFIGLAHAADKPRSCPPLPPPGEGGGFGPPPGHGGWRCGPPMPFVPKEADANKDGTITHAEIDAGVHADFDRADANHDGALDPKEFENGMPRPPAPPADAPKPPDGWGRPPLDPAGMFRRVDWNGDGKLSFDEFALPRRAMALHADLNGDGVMSEADRPNFEKGGPPPR